MTSRVSGPSVQDFPHIYPIQEQLRFLLRYAILAPSTRNTQPWRFGVDGNQVAVRADLARAQPIADDDLRELYLSLGCAIENLLVAAEQFGFRHSIAISRATRRNRWRRRSRFCREGIGRRSAAV